MDLGRLLLLLPALLLALTPQSAPCEDSLEHLLGLDLGLSGYLQFWWTVYEEAENGLYQPLTQDKAEETSSGFSLHKARLSINIRKERLQGLIQMRLESSPPVLLDAYAHAPLWGRRLEIWAGQMKVPSAYETAISTRNLDFMSRSRFARIIVDYSLSRSPSLSSPRFYGVKTQMRDLGIGFKGRLPGAAYFVMAGNGLGANRYIGGADAPQEVYTNRFGAYLYAARLDFGEWKIGGRSGAGKQFAALSGGGHLSYNYHPDMVLEGNRAVLDLDRRSWSANAGARILERVKLAAMYGECAVDDDFDNDGKTDYKFRGLELKAIADIQSGRLAAGFRYDLLAEEWYASGREDRMETYTLGLTYRTASGLKLQLNYSWKIWDSEGEPDLDDDRLGLMAQWEF